jgi:hypothetical protein
MKFDIEKICQKCDLTVIPLEEARARARRVQQERATTDIGEGLVRAHQWVEAASGVGLFSAVFDYEITSDNAYTPDAIESALRYAYPGYEVEVTSSTTTEERLAHVSISWNE